VCQQYDLSVFSYGDSLFVLNKTITLYVYPQKGLFETHYSHLDILAVGDSVGSSLNSFFEEFSYIWHEYAMEDDDRLLPRALLLKARILELVDKTYKINQPHP
jgi:hypothetical protein